MRACAQASPLLMAQDGLRTEPRVGYDPRGDQPFFLFKASNNGTTVLVSPKGVAMAPGDSQPAGLQADEDMLDELVDEVVSAYGTELIDRDSIVNSRMAETNATGFSVDSVEVAHARLDSLTPPRVQFDADVHYTGEQMVERMFAGDRVTARLQGYVVFDDERWTVEDDCQVEVEIDSPDD